MITLLRVPIAKQQVKRKALTVNTPQRGRRNHPDPVTLMTMIHTQASHINTNLVEETNLFSKEAHLLTRIVTPIVASHQGINIINYQHNANRGHTQQTPDQHLVHRPYRLDTEIDIN